MFNTLVNLLIVVTLLFLFFGVSPAGGTTSGLTDEGINNLMKLFYGSIFLIILISIKLVRFIILKRKSIKNIKQTNGKHFH